jgi:hypothetical protein
MAVAMAVLQTTLLRLLAHPGTDARLGRGVSYLSEQLKSQFPVGTQPTPRQIMAAVWSLVGQGLAYIDYTQSAVENWQLVLTDSGLAAARDEATNPDNAGEYLRQLSGRIPQASEATHLYARDAVAAYTCRAYLASIVMLGVASEAAFLEMAQAFGRWLPAGQSKTFLDILDNQRTNYITKFVEFRKRIEPQKPKIPHELSDGMALTFDSVLDLLRIYRNEAGHPTGKRVTREDVFTSLQMFARYLEKLYQFKQFFESRPLKP